MLCAAIYVCYQTEREFGRIFMQNLRELGMFTTLVCEHPVEAARSVKLCAR